MKPVLDEFEVLEIRLENIRGLRELHLNLRDSSGAARKRTLLIGKNGTCKSTILRCLAIGLADHTDAITLISKPIGSLLSNKKSSAQIRIELTNPGGSSTLVSLGKELNRSGDKDVLKLTPDIEASDSDDIILFPSTPFVCAYGAGRFGTGTDSGRAYRIADSVISLFDYQQPLIDPELTLHRLRTTLGTTLYDRTLRGLKRALGLSEEDEIAPRTGGGIVVSGPNIGAKIPFEAWADGYRLTFSWLLDLYAWAMRAGSIDENGHIQGILLLDEIEQHLHPSMQAEILPRLSELLPKMQIFATTHSPLVALDASPEELVVLRREGDEIVAEENVPNFLGYSVEDMLSDPRLFDTEVYGKEAREKIEEYRELAAIPRETRGAEQVSRLRSLAAEIGSFEGPTRGDNETSRLLKQLIRKHGL